MKHKIRRAIIYYENLKVKIGDEWVFMSLDKLKGLEIEGEIIKKRTRIWLE